MELPTQSPWTHVDWLEHFPLAWQQNSIREGWLAESSPLLRYLTSDEVKVWQTRIKKPSFTTGSSGIRFYHDFVFDVHRRIEKDLNFLLSRLSFGYLPDLIQYFERCGLVSKLFPLWLVTADLCFHRLRGACQRRARLQAGMEPEVTLPTDDTICAEAAKLCFKHVLYITEALFRHRGTLSEPAWELTSSKARTLLLRCNRDSRTRYVVEIGFRSR